MFSIYNPTDSSIDAFQSAGGSFHGLGPKETITVTERIKEDLMNRFAFLVATMVEEAPVSEEEAEAPAEEASGEVSAEEAPAEEAPKKETLMEKVAKPFKKK